MNYLINSGHSVESLRITVLHSAWPVILPSDCAVVVRGVGGEDRGVGYGSVC